ncbi:Phosphorylase b kinase regulatory subunit alpha [Homalodisca vitripennis]|nr:Phosphorylase b kinase regulatory subunit alpha [Homalodisca vitripennis]
MTSETQYADTEVEELLTMLRESEHLESEDFFNFKTFTKLVERSNELLMVQMTSETQYADTEVEELLTMLRESEHLESEDFFNFKTFTKLVKRSNELLMVQMTSETQYSDTEVEELLTMLRESENLESDNFFNFKTFKKIVEISNELLMVQMTSETQYSDTEVEELLTMLREMTSETQYSDTEVEELLTMLRESENLESDNFFNFKTFKKIVEISNELLMVQMTSETQYADTEVEELLTMLRESENLESDNFFNFKTFKKIVERSNELLMVQMTSETQYADTEVEELLTMLRELENLESDNCFNFKTFKKIVEISNEMTSETQYADTEVEELLTMLRESEHLEEQGDILQYLVDTQGLNYDTGMMEEGKAVTVKDLLKVLYEKACQQKLWGLVRHTAGMLGKRVEDLAKAVTDLLVRQKQVTVGMPPSNEHTITAPLPENELRQLIHQAYGDDESTAMLTQELLVYLAMFIRTEPQLFLEMLRLRVGLIIQVMATELSRTLICSGEEASEHLLNLSPFEMKNLLHHIMSGKEFAISSVAGGNFSVISCKTGKVSKKSQIGMLGLDAMDGNDEVEGDRQGQWLRRRRLDGALNRVPRDFYPRVWSVLEKCQGLAIEGRLLPQNLTQERVTGHPIQSVILKANQTNHFSMTSGELKFALAVETVLNTIPQPEYRQLVVEALMVLTLVTEHNVASHLGGVIAVENLVHKANQIFLQDQSPWWRHRCENFTQGQPDLPPRSGECYGYLSGALMVLTLVTEHNVASHLSGIIAVENLVHKANQIFLQDQWHHRCGELGTQGQPDLPPRSGEHYGCLSGALMVLTLVTEHNVASHLDLPLRSGERYGYLSGALMVLTLVTEHNVASHLGGIIAVENLVHKANQIFLQDQVSVTDTCQWHHRSENLVHKANQIFLQDQVNVTDACQWHHRSENLVHKANQIFLQDQVNVTDACQWHHRCGELGTQGQPDLPPRSGERYRCLSGALMVLTLVTEHNVASHLSGIIALRTWYTRPTRSSSKIRSGERYGYLSGALMVLTLVTEHNVARHLSGIIAVENLVHKANQIFLQDQVSVTDAYLPPRSGERYGYLSGALMVLTLVTEHNVASHLSGIIALRTWYTRPTRSSSKISHLGGIIAVENLVHKANQIFLQDQWHHRSENLVHKANQIFLQDQVNVTDACQWHHRSENLVHKANQIFLQDQVNVTDACQVHLCHLSGIIAVENLVHKANQIFLQDQVSVTDACQWHHRSENLVHKANQIFLQDQVNVTDACQWHHRCGELGTQGQPDLPPRSDENKR